MLARAKSIRSHLSDPHVLKAAKGLGGIEDGRLPIAVVPTRTLVVYKRIGVTGSIIEGKLSR